MKSRFIKIILLWIVLSALLGAVVMLLWNLLIPSIFGLASITYWQALGLFILARILFGSFGRERGGMMPHFMHHHMRENPIHEKWKNMTPEERKKFIEERKKFGFSGPFGRERFNMDMHDGSKENE